MRLHDWPERLSHAIEEARGKSFRWGQHDCCLFVADTVRAITGYDFAADLRGYETQTGAYRRVAEFGSIEALVSHLVGPHKAAAFAGRGDVVLAELDQGPTLGICLGNQCAFVGEHGLTFYPRTVASHAWSV